MRIFGGGKYNKLTATGTKCYPSLQVCDEIEDTKLVKMVISGTESKFTWKEVHDANNTNWETKYIKFDSNGVLSTLYKEVSATQSEFWKKHGKEYCTKNKLEHDPRPKSDLESRAMIVINLDESGSMTWYGNPHDFDRAVKSAKALVEHLKGAFDDPSQVLIQLWYNCGGARCVHSDKLD